jgi:hypothetical protein
VAISPIKPSPTSAASTPPSVHTDSIGKPGSRFRKGGLHWPVVEPSALAERVGSLGRHASYYSAYSELPSMAVRKSGLQTGRQSKVSTEQCSTSNCSKYRDGMYCVRPNMASSSCFTLSIQTAQALADQNTRQSSRLTRATSFRDHTLSSIRCSTLPW